MALLPPPASPHACWTNNPQRDLALTQGIGGGSSAGGLYAGLLPAHKAFGSWRNAGRGYRRRILLEMGDSGER